MKQDTKVNRLSDKHKALLIVLLEVGILIGLLFAELLP